MMRVGMGMAAVVLVGAVLATSVLPTATRAQSVPDGFPLDRTYRGISISGFDVQRSNLTLTARLDAKTNQVIGSGSGGCNNWSAAFLFRFDDRFDFSEVVTTRKLCNKALMTTEQAFLTTLRSAQTWRVDGNRLILEGDAGRLLMTATGKPAGKR